MSKYLRLEELEVWQDAMQLCKKVYSVLKDCKDYGLKDQMQRSSVSVPSNIAEGYERKSPKETTHFYTLQKARVGNCVHNYILPSILDILNRK